LINCMTCGPADPARRSRSSPLRIRELASAICPDSATTRACSKYPFAASVWACRCSAARADGLGSVVVKFQIVPLINILPRWNNFSSLPEKCQVLWLLIQFRCRAPRRFHRDLRSERAKKCNARCLRELQQPPRRTRASRADVHPPQSWIVSQRSGRGEFGMN